MSVRLFGWRRFGENVVCGDVVSAGHHQDRGEYDPASTATKTTPAVGLENASTVFSANAPIAAAAGIVRIHAATILRTTRQWTMPPSRPSPLPTTPPETTWVVESENRKNDEARIVVALAVSAEA